MPNQRTARKALRARRLAILIGYTIGALCFQTSRLAAQCALCKEALEAGAQTDGARLAMGFSWGILVMLGCVFALAGGLVSFIVYTVRAASSGGPGEVPSVAGESVAAESPR